jgi:hypothetical protein
LFLFAGEYTTVRAKNCKGQDYDHFVSRNGKFQTELGALHIGEIYAITAELFPAERKSISLLQRQNEFKEKLKLNLSI